MLILTALEAYNGIPIDLRRTRSVKETRKVDERSVETHGRRNNASQEKQNSEKDKKHSRIFAV